MHIGDSGLSILLSNREWSALRKLYLCKITYMIANNEIGPNGATMLASKEWPCLAELSLCRVSAMQITIGLVRGE